MTIHERLEEVFQNILGDDEIRLSDSTTAGTSRNGTRSRTST
jgi:hypothetical protein